ncbi:uncharacterized protein Z519_03119 [Cladophialophora bantiana CBS 173.52]|uniref:Cell wall mannoprotein PIR1-like C-terminal domain-containing protein n=1 Tax=Cladophialophora bantiana (strain ATCC 10958 / CBS 173.52 / CDC B-1940 / NIH 8579) TaxID=1442370 RepID=A0A0D2HRF9_CLAB1|nr:uncharacterized protein Z519_03119 [Cladophialophora bantiana CBS 173.52]KIW96053.1 hypothetical protein Z519_03119 [Cladophialophora bantiana CBS 173.52]
MRTFALLTALAVSALASPLPQGVTSAIAPSSPAPGGCQPSYSGSFEITVVNVSSASKRDLSERQTSGILTLTLADSILKDQAGRTGYIASNYQFQFDNPPQAGAIYTSGFSLCSNSSLALGGSAIWYQCLSGSFYNLYDRKWAPHCVPIYIYALIGSSAPPATQATDGQPAVTTAVPSVTQLTDGQPQVTSVVVTQISDGQPQANTAPPVTQISDGQPQAPSGTPVSQISDGQPQAPTGAPVTQISDGQPQAATGTPVTQISDGQPQAPTGAPVSQISDGQPQAPTGTPVTQISDGQPQAPTGAPVSQISDGQPQAPTGTPVTQISDGQPQAPTGAPVSQISDGQPQAPTSVAAASTTSSIAPATFSGAAYRAEFPGGVAVVAGIAG